MEWAWRCLWRTRRVSEAHTATTLSSSSPDRPSAASGDNKVTGASSPSKYTVLSGPLLRTPAVTVSFRERPQENTRAAATALHRFVLRSRSLELVGFHRSIKCAVNVHHSHPCPRFQAGGGFWLNQETMRAVRGSGRSLSCANGGVSPMVGASKRSGHPAGPSRDG